MKKSLSLILVLALVLTMFASTSFAADDLTLQEKYDILKSEGIINGNENGADFAALTNRAEFAKIMDLVWMLPEDVESASIFKDLSGYGWAKGYIGATTKAKFFIGVAEGKFAPGMNVTLEQLATVLVRAFNLEQSTDAVGGKVSTWAKGYVAAAIKAGLLETTTDYTVDAKRSDLVVSTYGAVQYKILHP
jgi:methionine salvage enolase-phosphatase E1